MPLNGWIKRYAWSIGVTALLLATACSELIKPQSTLQANAPRQNAIEQNPDGTYTWDGSSVPSGDASPSEILSASAGGYAPRAGTGGWVAGTMAFDNGDQYKMDLVYSVMNTTTSQPLYSNSTTTSNWNFGMSGGGKYYNLDLHLSPQCGFSVTNGGTAYARKAVPFRINVSLLKLPSGIGLGLGTITWGDATPMPMTAFSDPGIACSQGTANTCEDASATNYHQALPCTFPPPPATCGDRDASNYGSAGACTYPPPVCEDPWAANYGQTGSCEYPPPPPQTCNDPWADNYGAVGGCTYPPPPPPQSCDDPYALNYGLVGSCDYPPPPPPGDGGGGGGGGSYDPWGDNCDWWPDDPECGPPDAATSRIGSWQTNVTRSMTGSPRDSQQQPYHIVLLEAWARPGTSAIVGRYRMRTGYADVIYFPSGGPSGTDWTLAVRALQRDRLVAGRSASRRIIEIRSDGSQQFLTGPDAGKAMPMTVPVSSTVAKALDKAYAKGPGAVLKHADKRSNKRGHRAVTVLWPQ
jgi:hypothetical protein